MVSTFLDYDALVEISEHIPDGKTWKSFVWTCQALYQLNTPKKVRRYANHLATLLKLFPSKSWDWYALSSHPKLSFECVLAHRESSWVWSGLSQNPNLSFDFVTDHPELEWDLYELSRNEF